MKSFGFSTIVLDFMKSVMKLSNTKYQHMCAYMHHIHLHAPLNTHVHHQIPPKHKIHLVSLPSVLYETPGQNERTVLNQLFFVAFQVLFMKSTMLFSEKHERCCFSYERPFASKCNPMFEYLACLYNQLR